jgi:CBS domain-containing protein
VLEFVQHSRELDGSQERPAVVSVAPTTHLIDVFRKLAKTGLHRLYVVDGSHKPVGVVSLKDLLRFVLEHTK